MSHLWKYFRGYKLKASVAPFFKLFEALLELMIPVLVTAVIDKGIDGNNSALIWKYCGLMALFGFVGMLLSVISQYFSASAAVGFSSALREDLFGHILSMPREQTDIIGASALLTRMTSDSDRLQNGLNLSLRLLLRSPFIVFGSVVMALLIDLKIGLVFVVAVPVLAVIIFAVILEGIPMQKKVSKGLEKLTGITRANLKGVRVIRAFGQEDEQIEAFDSANSLHSKQTTSAGAFSAIMNPLTFIVINIAIIVIIDKGNVAVSTGRLTKGEVIALYNYMAQILTELVKLANLSVTITKALSCADRIAAVMKIPSESGAAVLPPIDEKAAVIEFDNAGFRYKNASGDALMPLSFRLEKGRTLGIIGGTGAGKSTLVELMQRYYDATSGTVKFNGVNQKELPVEYIRKNSAYVPQTSKLFAGTVADNIRWGKPDATDDEICEALKKAEALEFVLEKEGGINAEVTQGGKNFSGGQRQRLAIARALIRKPELLILDDSFSALDYVTERKLRGNINDSVADATVIISQRPSAVMSCDNILVLEDGECAGYGTHAELLEKCDIYREIYETQYGEGAANQ